MTERFVFVPGTVTDAVPCGATIRVQPQRWGAHACTRPSGHDGAHVDGVLLWCDPTPIDSAVTIYNRPTATEDDLR